MQKLPKAASFTAPSLANPEATQVVVGSATPAKGASSLSGSHPSSSFLKSAFLAEGPGPFWLGFGFILAGIGTVMLGPLLPSLSVAWGLSDAKGGILLAAKFSGGFLGGFGVLRRLGLSLLLGAVLCATGFGLFGFAGGLVPGSLALFVGGLGLGQMIASTNILVGRRYAPNSAPALALLNFFWSLGAVMAGLLVAELLPPFGLRNLLVAFAALFFVTALGSVSRRSKTGGPTQGKDQTLGPARPLSRPEFLHFAALLFLYGGLETSLSGWLTTYTLRFSDAHWLGGQSAVVLLWTALTVGRAIASGLMRSFQEASVRAGGLGLAVLAIAGLMASSHATAQLLCCALLGLGLAPFFPATFSRLMRHQPRERVAGFILAVSGVGATLFPWMVGVASARTGSLRLAMAVTLALTIALLAVAAFEPRPVSETELIPDSFST